ncbi:MAG: ferredoxin [Deltaproteobacteria bacterium]|nr:ferredoxin [Deltaproteobacteria bacterium]
MIIFDRELETEELLGPAALICMAARTAPKGKGIDLLRSAVVTAADKTGIADRMRQIALRDGIKFFARDAENVDQAQVLILLGTREKPLGLPGCGYCGFADCEALQRAGGICAFNSGDLGIALGSAVSRAADLRIDNRILFSAGKAAVELGILGPEVRVAFGLPLSVSGKSPFFDRKS